MGEQVRCQGVMLPVCHEAWSGAYGVHATHGPCDVCEEEARHAACAGLQCQRLLLALRVVRGRSDQSKRDARRFAWCATHQEETASPTQGPQTRWRALLRFAAGARLPCLVHDSGCCCSRRCACVCLRSGDAAAFAGDQLSPLRMIAMTGPTESGRCEGETGECGASISAALRSQHCLLIFAAEGRRFAETKGGGRTGESSRESNLLR